MSNDSSTIIGTSGSVFGIDLGTTFSAIAYLDTTGQPQTISNSRSKKVTPSVVYIQEPVPEGQTPEILIGEAALSKKAAEPNTVHELFKRRIGEPNADEIVNGKPWTPTAFSTELLKGMVEEAKAAGFNVHDVVITHPAYFSPEDIKATQEAGKAAGLNVISMLPEPVAAALFYGIRQAGQTKTIAVYDLGGGTFDATLVRIGENQFEMLDFDGRKTLGGADWDARIVNWCIDRAVAESGCARESITDDVDAMAELSAKAVQAKIDLTDLDTTTIVFTAEDGRHKIELTREKFEELTSDLLKETREKMEALLRRAAEGEIEGHKGERIEKVDDILLVGGSTFMPQVMRMVKEAFGAYCDNEPMFCDVNEAVAKGAALKAQAVEFQEAIKREAQNEQEKDPGKSQKEAEASARQKFIGNTPYAPEFTEKLLNIRTESLASRSYGIVALVNDIETVVNLIVMKAKLPAEGEDTFGLRHATGPAGGKMPLLVYASEVSEEMVDMGNATLRKLTQPTGEDLLVDLPPNLPKGSPIKIRFELSDQGILDIHSVDEQGNKYNGSVDTNQ